MLGTKKILIVLPALSGGGAQRVMTVLMKFLDRTRFIVHLMLITDYKEVFVNDVPPDVTVHRLHCQRVRWSLFKLIPQVWEIRPDVIFTALGYLNIYLLFVKPFLPFKTRIVIREANTPSQSLKYGRLFLFLRLMYRCLYRFADGVICQTSDIALELMKDYGVHESRVHIIVNPIDISRINDVKKTSLNPFSVRSDFHLLAAGRLTYQKGFDILLLAMAELIKASPFSVHLSILGDGEEMPTLRKMIRGLNLTSHVTLAGFVSPIEAYLCHADLFVLSSRWEGMPNVALEALAYGTPVVAMEKAGGIGGIIKNGINGRLVTSLSSSDLAQTINQAIKELDSLKKGTFLDPKYFAENASRGYEKALCPSLS